MSYCTPSKITNDLTGLEIRTAILRACSVVSGICYIRLMHGHTSSGLYAKSIKIFLSTNGPRGLTPIPTVETRVYPIKLWLTWFQILSLGLKTRLISSETWGHLLDTFNFIWPEALLLICFFLKAFQSCGFLFKNERLNDLTTWNPSLYKIFMDEDDHEILREINSNDTVP